MKDPTSKLRTATRRAKSDVANKLISMFLHELSRKICRDWGLEVDGEKYEALVRLRFGNRCPYCLRNLDESTSVVEHLDGMSRYRIGLHVPGNVLVACRRCNSEKRRDDCLRTLILADSGWESFLSHDGSRCTQPCANCRYWSTVWEDVVERKQHQSENIRAIRAFRQEFPEFEGVISSLRLTLPSALSKLYSDCQAFSESEIRTLLERF